MLQFLPDATTTTPEVLVDVSADPTTRGYRNPLTPISAGIAALAANSVGGALVTKLDGSKRTFAGTQTKLYEISGGLWADVSRGGSYSLGSAKWRFVQFGDSTFATTKSEVLQYSNTGAFADVSTAPKAACICTAAYFVMLANLNGTGTGYLVDGVAIGDEPDRWTCSQIFNPLGTWVTAAATQATSGRLADTSGGITGLKRLGNDIVAYKEEALYLARSTGPGEVWNFQIVADDVGCATQEAVVSSGAVHYFIGANDIYRFDGVSRPDPIGAGIKEWFFGRFNRLWASNIETLHDAVNSTVKWFVPTGSSTIPTMCLAYNYVSKTWGTSPITLRTALNAITASVTYANVQTMIPTYQDASGVSYDTPLWRSSTPILSVIGSDNVLYQLTGTMGPSFITSGHIGDESMVRTCDRLRPKFRVSPKTGILTPMIQMALGDLPTVNPPSALTGGKYDLVQAAHYHQFRQDFTGQMEIESMSARFPGESEE